MNNANKSGSSSSGGGATSKKAEKESREKLSAIFDEFKDADSTDDEINIEGTMEYCSQLEVSPEDVVLLALSFYLQSPTMGKFKRNEFISGWRTLADGSAACDTIQGQKKRLPKLLEELQKDSDVKGELATKAKGGLYKRVYEYTYAFARPEGQKSLRECQPASGNVPSS